MSKKYENIINGIVKVRFNEGFLINDNFEFLVDELERALPKGTNIISRVFTWDFYYLFGYITISIVDEGGVHEHYTFKWCESWQRLIDYMNQKIKEGV